MSKLHIYIDEDQPFTISGGDDYLRKFVSDISYGIEYNGGRNPIVGHTNDDGSVIIIIPTKVRVMFLDVPDTPTPSSQVREKQL